MPSRPTTHSTPSYQGEQMLLFIISIGIVQKTELSRKRVRKRYITYHLELSRKWSGKIKNPSCTELSRKWSRFFIYKGIFDLAIIPYLLVYQELLSVCTHAHTHVHTHTNTHPHIHTSVSSSLIGGSENALLPVGSCTTHFRHCRHR